MFGQDSCKQKKYEIVQVDLSDEDIGKEQRISIEARSIESLVELTLSDNATGVLPEFQKHLFELLSTTKKEGMGLGLWLCKYILTRHEGNIYYEDAQGGGAKFTIRLPSVVEKA
jgi:C4-dicarboxylate-specific signal transduction histidine kinase